MTSCVLVTGGAGFIGSHTVDLLLEKGYAVRILDSLQPRVHPNGLPDYVPREADVVVGDVADRTTLEGALEGVDYVVHLAAYQDYLRDFATFIHVNTESSALLFELIVANRLPVRKIVFASSQSVAGEGRYACMRYTYVQGSRNSFYNAYSGICRIFALRIQNGSAPVCFEDGGQLRDYVNVRDVARANLLAMEEETDRARIFNVGGGRAVSVRQFAEIMLSACGSSLEPSIPGQFRVGDTRHTVSDITSMRGLGWEPTIPVEQNVREYLDWFCRYRDTGQYLVEADRLMREQNVIRSVA